MNPRLARKLITLYPRSWRARYEDEFAALLETQPPSARVVANVVGSACLERVRSWHGPALIVNGWLAAIVASMNLVASVDDTPLVAIVQAHRDAFAFWNVLAGASLAAFAAAIVIGLAAVGSAIATRTYHALRSLVFPVCAFVVLVAWVLGVAIATHWAPSPWDITGDWIAPAFWPPLTTRWIFGGITGLLLALAVAGAASALPRAIGRAEVSRSAFVRLAGVLLASALVVMTAGAFGWGVLALRYAPAIFESHAGGVFGSRLIVSWAVSLILFVFAASAGLRGALTVEPRSPRPTASR